jgi:Fe-Mn family superoxide dismutase
MSNQNIHRRKFIANTAKAGLGLAFIPSLLSATTLNIFGEPIFGQQPLPYGYKDLEPVIDVATMEIHYTKHAAAYAKNLDDAFKAEYKKSVIEDLAALLGEISKYSVKMRNNAGGHYNHEFFWQCMTPKSTGKPTGKLEEAMIKNFGSLDNFKSQFSDAAKNRFGSGWAWLIVTEKGGDLKITSSPNQDNPLMDIAEVKGYPVLGLDVWEHAYYLKYQNKRVDYITNWWSIVNWSFVEQRFADYQKKH